MNKEFYNDILYNRFRLILNIIKVDDYMFDENIKFKYSWRPYQAKVLKEVDKYIDDKKVNIVAAPGSGKTVLGLELARRLAEPVLILSPTVTIKNQWIDRFVTLFMPEGSTKPEWISDNIYELSYFNSVTYQGLHYAYKRRNQKIEVNLEETDDEVLEENTYEDIDVKKYNLVAQLKKQKIKTIVLDEAHHLKSEWWQSLVNVIEEIGDVTIISLTATPPYDIEYNEWKKYTKLCGNIDMEISVPELVQAKNLCPHQDYVYFSYPTEKEKDLIKEYENEVKELVERLKSNVDLVNIIQNHPYVREFDIYTNEIFERTEFYSSMLIFLNASNVRVNRENVKVLGHNKPIPNITVQWIEILLQNILFENDKYFENYPEILEWLKSNLNKLGAIEQKKVMLSKNSSLYKYFVNSISKLESINKIVEAEYNNLRENLRMVILTDFLRKEYLFEEDVEINKLGVFPILLNLLERNRELKIAVLTGSIFMIPNSEKEKLIEIARKNRIGEKDINFTPISKIPMYSIVKTTNQNKNVLMKSISTLFSNGDVNIIIGTKSLLGEGWDEPSINSLILASFVGSFVLSNQMRGRAIRTNDNPYKTANIWHLVCVAESESNTIENADFETLERRFDAFVGIGYNLDVLENGIERLDIIPEKFTKNAIDKYNKEIIEISDNRQIMYDRWFYLISRFGGNTIKMNNQLEIKKEDVKKDISVIQASKVLKFVILILVLWILRLFIDIYINTVLSVDSAIDKIMLGMIELGILSVIIVVTNIKFIIQCVRAVKFSIPEKQMHATVKVIVKTLCDVGILKTEFKDIKVYSIENHEIPNVTIKIDGVTTHENNIILNAVEEVFSDIENQRYIITNRKNKILVYRNVPSVLSTNKELAESFLNNWKRYIGEANLVYTKSVEGRRQLLEARNNSYDYTTLSKFENKKKPISEWK